MRAWYQVFEFSNVLSEYHRIQKFTINTDLRKQDFLSEEKIIDRSCFVNQFPCLKLNFFFENKKYLDDI